MHYKPNYNYFLLELESLKLYKLSHPVSRKVCIDKEVVGMGCNL